MTGDGRPFFWLGDTAWELFHRATRAEAGHYLATRAAQGFNVIQAVLLAEFNGLHAPNAYGHVPLLGDDPTRPNEYYFRYVDELVRTAASWGLYMGLLPAWGDKVTPSWGIGPLIFDERVARVYGEYLGHRYRDYGNILWILGGDRTAESDRAIWCAMAGGIIAGLGRRPLLAYHPSGGSGSSAWFHDTDCLGLNMWQSGHARRDAPVWDMIASDYTRRPARPVIDAEPNYEDHPVDPWSRAWQPEHGRFTDHDVRKQAYRSVFAGACGHTYGHHSVWQFYSREREPVMHPMPYWDEAILRPGAAGMIHLQRLMLSRPYFERVPDQAFLASDPGAGERHVQATRSAAGRYAFVYIPQSDQQVEIDLGSLAGRAQAWWYCPRTGRAWLAGVFDNHGRASFTSPIGGPDWVLVLDEIAAGFPPPGQL
jgi:hypothetical protein